jgi:hypothetical protein
MQSARSVALKLMRALRFSFLFKSFNKYYIMNYTIPLADQFHQAFLFTIDHKCNGQIIPKQILLSKNLNELDTMSFDNLRKMAKKQNIPVVIDGGSWKPGFAEILPFVNYAICSANFYPPNCKNQQDVFAYLQNFNIPHIAITQGENPIQYLNCSQFGVVNVPKIQPVDTLGAGDIFQGAFCLYILETNFIEALALAGNTATEACKYFGTRPWLNSNI